MPSSAADSAACGRLLNSALLAFSCIAHAHNSSSSARQPCRQAKKT
ncbi:MAG: hypothetical protein ACRDYA_19630 [Egibacteraceae bacterium]